MCRIVSSYVLQYAQLVFCARAGFIIGGQIFRISGQEISSLTGFGILHGAEKIRQINQHIMGAHYLKAVVINRANVEIGHKTGNDKEYPDEDQRQKHRYILAIKTTRFQGSSGTVHELTISG